MKSLRLHKLVENLVVLVVDDNPYMRKLTRMMLMNAGVRAIYEAGDGVAALEVIRGLNPDIMVLDWDMPVLNGPQVVKIVRSPGVFPKPNLPIIMLTSNAERSRVREAMRLGVHEFLIKPTSPQALRDRLVSILVKPREMMQFGDCYVPEPRTIGAKAVAAA